MGIIIWITFGFIAGSVATVVMPGPDRLGIAGTILLGVIGAILGGALGTMTGGESAFVIDIRSVLMAVVGTLFVLFSYRTFSMRGVA